MPGTVWSKFYWSDWSNDPALRICSLAAQGLWMRLLCIAAEAEPLGHVTVNGRGLAAMDIARYAGCPLPEIEPLLAELEQNGVFSRDRKGTIYSRRMVRDAKNAETARKNGKNGGNPTLRKYKQISGGDNPPDKGRDNTHMPIANSHKPEEASLRSASSPRSRADVDAIERRCREAAGLVDDASAGLLDISPILGALDRGLSLESDILPPMREAAARGKRGQTWRFYAKIVDDVARRNSAISGARAPAPVTAISVDQGWRNKVRQFLASGLWLSDWGPPPGSDGCRVPSDILEEFGFGHKRGSAA